MEGLSGRHCGLAWTLSIPMTPCDRQRGQRRTNVRTAGRAFFFFWQHSMRSEVDPIELALGGLPWPRAGPVAQRQAPRHELAQGLHASENRSHHL